MSTPTVAELITYLEGFTSTLPVMAYWEGIYTPINLGFSSRQFAPSSTTTLAPTWLVLNVDQQ